MREKANAYCKYKYKIKHYDYKPNPKANLCPFTRLVVKHLKRLRNHLHHSGLFTEAEFTIPTMPKGRQQNKVTSIDSTSQFFGRGCKGGIGAKRLL